MKNVDGTGATVMISTKIIQAAGLIHLQLEMEFVTAGAVFFSTLQNVDSTEVTVSESLNNLVTVAFGTPLPIL